MSDLPTTSLLLEIGCEEIPARFLEDAEACLKQQLEAGLLGNRLLGSPAGQESGPPLTTQVMHPSSTPRRLAVYVPGLLVRQLETPRRITGPSVSVGIDRDGLYTRAANAFAERYNAQVNDLKRAWTPKGEYLALEITEAGHNALQVLAEVLPVAIRGLMVLPKTMYWTQKAGPRFVRPIRWILALLGEGRDAQVVPFEFAGIHSGEFTFGHRLKGNAPIRVTGSDDYVAQLRNHWVEPDAEVRLKRVRSEIKVLLEDRGLRPVADAWLESWHVNSTEWPQALVGSFDSRFLQLPREILTTVMRDHQKYFAVEDRAGNLQPYFTAVLNTEPDAGGLIRRGHERVLAARFSDAEFFWTSDQKIPLKDRLPMLERVSYHDKLGTYADKVRRMKMVAEKVCEELANSGRMTAHERQHALGAVELCKCDLTTQMVQEFTELQGVIGGLYAKVQGEPEEVAGAIYDHYRPLSFDDACPRSAAGAVVSLADKLDSVVSGFSVGLEPTGSSDPFGLRRAGNGIVKVAAEKLPGLRLDRLPHSGLAAASRDGLEKRVSAFLRERVEYYLREAAGLRYDTTRAVMSSVLGWSDPSDAILRGKALEQIIDSPDYAALSQAAKRTRNILSKSASKFDAGIQNPRPELMSEPEEQELYRAFESIRGRLLELEAKHEYGSAFLELASLRQPVDQFFDRVLVMVEQEEIRTNRLALLHGINTHAFSRLADLSEIAVV